MAKCATSSQPVLNVPTLISSQANDVHCKSTFLTPTLGARSPLFHRSPAKSASKLSPNCLHIRHGKVFSDKLIQDRLIPSRSLTDLKLASHLLSPLSLNKWTKDNDVDECFDTSHRILQFGKSPKNRHHEQRPLSLLNKPKMKIPSKPDRVMAAPGSFMEYGIQSAHWSPSEMLAVALESGIFICKVNECSTVIEVRDSSINKNCPFRFVHWNSQGDALICGKLSGEIQICDMNLQPNHVLWHLNPHYPLRSMVLEQEYLLTCGTKGNGVHIYDIRQDGESTLPIIQLETKRNTKQTISYVNWSPNGHTFACGTESGFIYLWDIRHTLRELYHHRTHEHNPVKVLNFCPWKPSILVSGCGIPEPSLCVQSNQLIP